MTNILKKRYVMYMIVWIYAILFFKIPVFLQVEF